MKQNLKPQLLIFFLCLTIIGYAQMNNNGSVSILDPTVASFMKFIDNPVNTFNGAVDITIPVHTIKAEGVEYPITLRYNTSGIKVNEEASNVGLGWNLNLGGVITHNFVGEMDYEYQYSSLESVEPSLYSPGGNIYNKWVHFDYAGIGVNSDWKYPTDLWMASICDGSYYEDVLTVYEATKYGKGEPDIFYFSFLNYAGKFYIDY